ncbi:MAG: hypothetical protein WCV70_02290 [Patescibacteria group bacterium]|jgi:hypothetical protein
MKKLGVEIDVNQLKHGQKVKIYLTGVRKGETIVYQTFSIEVANLFRDLLNHLRISQILNDRCKHKAGYTKGICCHEHISQNGELRKLEARAEKILPGKIGLPVLCPDWWKKLGFKISTFNIIIS